MVYGILRFINFAHGDIFILGAFASFYLAPKIALVLPLPSIAGGLAVLVISMLICATLGVLIERFAYRPLRQSPRRCGKCSSPPSGVHFSWNTPGSSSLVPRPKEFP